MSFLSESESAKSLDNAKIKTIREDFIELRDRVLKPKMKEIRKNLYEIENKNISESKIKEIEKHFFELEESPFQLKKSYDYDDAEYKGIRDIKNLFNKPVDKDYYKPIKITNGFDNRNNYIEYESKGDKDKILLPEEYLNMIRPYLSDIVNEHKTQEVWNIHSDNKVIDYKTTLG